MNSTIPRSRSSMRLNRLDFALLHRSLHEAVYELTTEGDKEAQKSRGFVRSPSVPCNGGRGKNDYTVPKGPLHLLGRRPFRCHFLRSGRESKAHGHLETGQRGGHRDARTV